MKKNILENISSISIHVPIHRKPINDEEFSYYLAGLIDSNGNFEKDLSLKINFNILDISLAYFIKKKIGYGSVKKIKNDIKKKSYYNYIIFNINYRFLFYF